MHKLSKRVALLSGFVLFAACATTPAQPPTSEAIKDKAGAEGVQRAYEHYHVQVEGNACLGHDVIVGPAKEKAPARYYFSEAPFEVDYTNNWAYYLGKGFTVCGSLSLIPFTVLTAAGDPLDALTGIMLCSVPLVLTGVTFTAVSEWNMEEAGQDYNDKLKEKLNAAISSASPAAATQQSAPNQDAVKPDGTAQQPTQTQDNGAQPQDRPADAATPFTY